MLKKCPKSNWILEKLKYQNPTEKVAIGEGLCVVQCFGQIPLYSTLDDLGLEYQTDKICPNGSINLLDSDERFADFWIRTLLITES